MGLAGVGRPEHRGDAGAGSPFIARTWTVKTKRPYFAGVSCVAGVFVRGLCFTMRRRCGRGLSSGTSPERIAPESLTPADTPASFTATSRVEAIEAALDQVCAGSTSGGFAANSLNCAAGVESEVGKSQGDSVVISRRHARARESRHPMRRCETSRNDATASHRSRNDGTSSTASSRPAAARPW